MKVIGILEDDEKLGKELSIFLERGGYEGRYISPGSYKEMDEDALLALLLDMGLNLLLLDIGLPGINGIHLCKQLRKVSDLPVIMITSDNSQMTELMSITGGADDFVPKPFNPQILLARMERLLDRIGSDNRPEDKQEIRLSGGLTFTAEFLKGKVTGPSLQEADLTKNEIQILKILCEHLGEVVSRDAIISALWDNQSFVDDNTLTVNMTRLKTKLESIGIEGAIVTKRGMGYQLL